MNAIFRLRGFCNAYLSFNFSIRRIASKHNNLADWLNLDESSASPSKTAVIGFGAEGRFSYGDLGRLVGRYVSLLHGQLSIRKGDRIVARVQKSVDTLALYLAAVKIGAIYVPVNPSYTWREMQHYVNDAMPAMLITNTMEVDNDFAKSVPQVIDVMNVIEKAHQQQPSFHTEPVEEHDIASICYTSGTTGLPKGAMLSHGNLLWGAKTLVSLWKFNANDVLLHCLPFYHVHGMFISLNCSLLSSSTIIFLPKFSVDDVLKYLPQSTVMMGVPTYYSRLLESKEFNKKKLESVRLFVSGSAPLSGSTWNEFYQRTGHRILERYGMTETAVITSNPYSEIDRRPGTVGKILSGGKIRLSQNSIVEIQLPSVFRGYWRNPEKTKKEFTKDNFFITGDMGSIDKDGYLQILGRSKDLIITGGLNVYPKEVEDVLDEDDLIKESAAIGIPHPDFGEAVVAVCVPTFCSVTEAAMKTESLITRLRMRLAAYKLPKRFIFLDVLPRNSMGKVQKNVLRKNYATLFSAK
uniref:AMP-binding domain-containing protein n=1 Tax=Syphacia muris TaxID=451379 RepID=A0A0N5A989_9BILA